MALERKALEAVFEKLGKNLTQPATLCIFGSSPAILLGQPSRQTQDIDIWHPASDYDSGDLARACASAGVLYDPKSEVAPDAVYLQIVRPGVVALPPEFETEKIGRYGFLTVVMPTPVVLSTAKLVRGTENDVNDIVWWTRQRSITLRQLERMIEHLADPIDQETARDNLVFVRLITGDS
jgi:hypothetical protein